MANMRASKCVLVDVGVEGMPLKPYCHVLVPVPEAGTYEVDGVKQMRTGSIYLRDEDVHFNKTQSDPDHLRGVAFVSPIRSYAVHLDGAEDGRETIVRYSGRDLRKYNEEFGQPALTRAEKARAAEEARLAPGAQMNLFDDYAIPAAQPEDDEMGL